MDDTIRILVTLAEHADSGLVESAVEGEPSLEVVGYSDYLDDWREFLAQQADIVIVACSAADDDTTAMVNRAVKHRPDRPVVVMSEASPNGFLREAFEAGADDVITLPQPPDAVAFTLQKVIARRKGIAIPGKPTAPLICILGPKGGTGKTLVVDEPRGRARRARQERRARRPRPAVRRRRPGARALRPSGRSTTS